MLRAEGAILGEVRQMMERVVEGERGTGRRSRVEGLQVAGKTGTSQNPHGLDHAFFVSYAPADAPHLALVIVLERRGHGGEVAAPTAGAFWTAYREWRVRADAIAEMPG
jgi:cell division protein FtsI/penicillin-binding protein 2